MGKYKVISNEEGLQYGFGRYPVTVIPHILVPARDGIKLAVKLWFPANSLGGTTLKDATHHVIYNPEEAAAAAPSPVVMEYIPYRKSDGTLSRDHRRLTWLASHGYVSARVEMRGSGDSEGVYFGEYLPQEQHDACDIIAWFAEQAWCNGNVGMYGKSWSGFNGLQVAYEKPPALKAAISLYSTDDRYASDVHFMGGCIIANQSLWWSSYMFTLNAAPPHPGLVPNWRDLWRQRLEAGSEPWAHDWFSHQARDEFWKHASVCEDPSRLSDCAILLIGGWNDGYHDTVFRGAATFPNVRGILGPWCHDWPDVGAPGPAVSFTDECLRWWDCHLKGKDNGVMGKPLLRAYVQESFSPEPNVFTDRAGRWVSETEWPPKGTDRWLHMVPDNTTGTLHMSKDAISTSDSTADIKFTDCAFHGAACGEWWYIATNSVPGDQRTEDAQTLCWTSAELSSDVSILGFPELELSVAVQGGDMANVVVRICDVFPDGKSNLITWGTLNLTHRDGHNINDIKPLVPGERYKVKVTCLSIGYTVPKGHRIRVAVAPNYWPLVWPSKDAVDLRVTTGIDKVSSSEVSKVFHTYLILPVKPLEPPAPRRCPEFLPAREEYADLPVDTLRPASYRRHVETDVSSHKQVFVVTQDSGKQFLHQTGVATGSKFEARYSMADKDPLSASVDIDYVKEYDYPDVEGGIRTVIETYSHMTADKVNFHFEHELEVIINDEKFFSRKWTKDIPRFNV